MNPFLTPQLDRDLLAGADPHRDPALERRGEKVCEQRNRDKLATALEAVVARAARGGSGFTAAAPLDPDEVLPAQIQLTDIARRLRSGEEVDPQGILLVRKLLTDPASALNSGAGAGSLRLAVRRVSAALDPR
jgi:hypothetical protein